MAYTHQGGGITNTASAPTEAYIPMRFWFCRNPGLAVPLIALQYHEVKFNIQFALASTYSFSSPAVTPALASCNFAVYADYVYLDTTERRQFAQNAHEYLIDQLQVNQSNDANIASLHRMHTSTSLTSFNSNRSLVPEIPKITPSASISITPLRNLSGAVHL